MDSQATHNSDSNIAQPRSTWRAVAVPIEHGGWSLTLEPVVLGLLVAWSWPGFALGFAALLGFMARTPIKVVLVDWRRGRWIERSRTALVVAAIELTVIGGLAVVVIDGSDRGFWVPLALAVPLVAVELWFDMRSRSRYLLPEIAGAVAISSVAAAIALSDGRDAKMAVGLWCVVAVRSGAAIPFVRTQLLRAKGREHSLWHSDVAQLLAVTVVIASWLLGLVPLAAVLAIALLGAIHLASVRSEPRPAVVIGVQQMLFGFVVVAVTATAILV